ncbi:8e7ecdd1-b1ee-4503-af3c-fe634be80221 [Sclerotinia trifoliorum]|uniref:8e7ecdd1-b1ee-4503-af3c-fe634be80221 n=1 Tax=Sclerotinia trifoliorum TaxID=28548 RepID=A0A8H2W2Q3_9HELO|nr:8e7ecdd1-b1ee-4503-af3c-fe634be80221 [Sclerotinia trifoliorum]
MFGSQFSTILQSVLLFSLLGAITSAQITLTGCHIKEGREVCFFPAGAETTISSSTVTPTLTSLASVNADTTESAQTTAITDCHQHDTTQYCVKGNGDEVQVLATATGNEALPTAYNGCHSHDSTMFCLRPDGAEVEVLSSNEEAGSTEGESTAESSEGGENCHFHAGVEHCVGGSATAICERKDRDYNVKLRIGLLFVILFTSAIGVYAPIVMARLLKTNGTKMVFTVVKQFGTGVIIATALVHLATHASLMFGNSCLGELKYEATTTAIMMAGAFIAFLIDFTGHRLAHWRQQSTIERQAASISSHDNPREEAAVKGQPTPTLAHLSHHHDNNNLVTTHANDGLSIFILEAGIIFHSLLIGITLVVAGDSVFITLFIVIVFHQMFEGLALGARIAVIDGLHATKYIILPMAFTLVTPTGMAIGIGVINQFNGNDPSTIVALGTLDALSAGILTWIGFVNMWAHDWIYGELRDAGLIKTLIALISLMAGMALMGLLGKWA